MAKDGRGVRPMMILVQRLRPTRTSFRCHFPPFVNAMEAEVYSALPHAKSSQRLCYTLVITPARREGALTAV